MERRGGTPAGQTIATKKPGGLPSFATTLFKYDSYGNLTKVADPDGNVSTYLYNYLNLLYQKTTPDEGTVKYAYNEAGELIAMQTSDNVIRVMNYDVFGRVISQQIVPSTYSSSIFANSGLPWLFALSTWNTTFSGILNNVNNKKEKLWYYDSYSTTTSTTIASNANKYLTLSPTKTKGRVAQSISYDHNNNKAVEYRFFAYDNDGFLKWEIAQFNETGITSTAKGRLVRIDYPSYNLQGASLTQNIDLNCDHTLDLQYSYAYDSQNRLTDVYTSYNGTGASGHRMVNYTYDDLTRMVKEKRYYTSATTCDNVETEKVTYTYDQRFRLTDISSTSNLFRWQMFYDGNNPAGGSATNFSNNYNGNINATVATYGTAGASNPPTTGFAGPTIYNYKYDVMNRLTMADATLQYASPALANEALLGDETYTYDDPGNILSLSRGEISGTTISTVNYVYNYALATNNRLTSMNKNGVLDRTITYDNNGCLLSDTKRAVTAVTIGRANLPFKITMGANNTLYLYDINDQRIYKKQSNNTTNVEYYIRNASGQELGVFKMNNNQLTWYVAGGERVRRFAHAPALTFTSAAAATWLGSTSTTLDPFTDPLSVISTMKILSAFSYLYDHLGNTRVVYTASFNCATPTTQTRTLELMSDYYPFGKVLRSFDPAPADEKYLMTQKERDSETGLDYFGARYYDSDVCRWLSVDPLADKYPGWSVYNYVIGNPVMLIDPNGMGWISVGSGASPVWDEDVTTQAQAISAYGEGANYVGLSGYEYTSKGRKVRLLDGGNWQYITEDKPPAFDWVDGIEGGTDMMDVALNAKSYEQFGRSADEVTDLLGQGTFLHNNKVYKLGYLGNQYDPAKAVRASKGAAKTLKIIGKAGMVINTALTGYEVLSDLNQHKYYAATARTIVAAIQIGCVSLGPAGWIVAAGIGIVDAVAGDAIYEMIQTKME